MAHVIHVIGWWSWCKRIRHQPHPSEYRRLSSLTVLYTGKLGALLSYFFDTFWYDLIGSLVFSERFFFSTPTYRLIFFIVLVSTFENTITRHPLAISLVNSCICTFLKTVFRWILESGALVLGTCWSVACDIHCARNWSNIHVFLSIPNAIQSCCPVLS